MASGSLKHILACTPVKEREKVKQEHEEKFRQLISVSNQQLKKQEQEAGRKKKDGYALLEKELVDMALLSRAIRSIATYKPKSYNPDKQLHDFVKHLFVKYPVPQFMYQCMLKQDRTVYLGRGQNHRPDEFLYLHDIYRDWFITLAQGGSFQKAVKGLMTKKEAVLFLGAPNDAKIHENVWWAKMKALDMPSGLIDKLIDRVFGRYFVDDPDGRLSEVLFFFAHFWKELGKQELDAIIDFVDWKLRNDREFRFKGRTATSMIKLSNEWHIAMQKAKLGHNLRWDGFGMELWRYESKDFIWEVTELLTNKELYSEGRKQKHCVYSYVQRCVSGGCSIFSMREYKKFVQGVDAEGKPLYGTGEETRRITIEVSMSRQIVQVRGNLNRAADDEERRVLRMWSGEVGFTSANR